MKILHTEASPGWGGQEMRIVEEAIGMRARGHQLFFAVQKGATIAFHLRKAGFVVYELSFSKKKALVALWTLMRIFARHQIEIINTHSSLDSWIGGIVGRLCRKKVVRTRHLSTAVRPGINSKLLYRLLPDYVVTTCADAANMIQKQAKLPSTRISSIPTGMLPMKMKVDQKAVADLRRRFGFQKEDVVVGTACVFRGWKGIEDLLHAAKLLEQESRIKFLLVGSGVSEAHFKEVHRKLRLEKSVFFAGHLSPPYTAIAAMDIFTLLSWAHEGVSQAALQAAYLERALLTTATGGLKEVCLHGQTGVQVNVQAAEEVAEAILQLADHPQKRQEMGIKARKLVEQEFLFETMIDKMEAVYGGI